MFIVGLGAVFFGLIIGWIVYRILRLKSVGSQFSDLIAILAAIGGAAVLALFKSDVIFGWYSVGLLIGFFAYFTVGLILYGKQEVQPWRVEPIPPTPNIQSDIPSSKPDVQQEVEPWRVEPIPPTSNPNIQSDIPSSTPDIQSDIPLDN